MLFFTATNPGIALGGFVGERKEEIMAGVPSKWKPRDCMIGPTDDRESITRAMERAGFDFPAVAKPDVGERGLLVSKIDSIQDLLTLMQESPVVYMLQEYISYPEEVSIFYTRMPGEQHGEITSVTLKEYLNVVGDGVSTIEQLIRAKPRALLQLEALRDKHGSRFRDILSEGERYQFHTIGNHSKGTMFMDGNHLISDRLQQTFDAISQELEGIYYCRYDIKCASWEALEKGEDFRILEINGIKSEPAHIYDPNYPVTDFYRTIWQHWDRIYAISKANRARGVATTPVPEAWKQLRSVMKYHKELD